MGSYSEEELEIEEQEFGGLEEDSPPPDPNPYIPSGMPMMSAAPMRNAMHASSMAAPSQLMAAPMLQQQM
jgi:hypothetical protein